MLKPPPVEPKPKVKVEKKKSADKFSEIQMFSSNLNVVRITEAD
jgi:hypothetical protein